MSNVPKSIIEQLKRIQNEFLWNGSNPKIKYNTLSLDFKNGGLKNVDVDKKIISLRCSWVRKMYDNTCHDWKIIPSFLVKKYLGENFQFHSNLHFRNSMIQNIPSFYKEILKDWKQFFSSFTAIPSCILSQHLWYNRFIKVDNLGICFSKFAARNVNNVIDLFASNGKVKTWRLLKNEFDLSNDMYFQWMQIINAIPKQWKEKLLENASGNPINIVFKEHHIIKNSRIVSLNKLISKEIYNYLITEKFDKPTSQKYFENLFNDQNLKWELIYTLPRKITKDSYTRNFQYKILNNILYLNKKLYLFGKVETPLCSYCMLYDESIIHLFWNCVYVKNLWQQLQLYFNDDFKLPDLTLQTAIFGFWNSKDYDNEIFQLINHLLLIFKINIYKARDKKSYRIK